VLLPGKNKFSVNKQLVLEILKKYFEKETTEELSAKVTLL
jgi:hypothetical protein